MIFKRFIMVNTILLLLFLLVSSDLISQEKIQKNDFRNSRWGMKKDKVLSTEKNKPTEAAAVGLFFVTIHTGEIAGLKAQYLYYFLDDVLVRGGYTFREKHYNKNKYIDDYNNLKEILTRKYGSPTTSNTRWYKDHYKDRPQYHGRAVSMGELVFVSNWETDRTLIFLILTGDNFNISMVLQYNSKLYKELIDKAEEKSQEQGL